MRWSRVHFTARRMMSLVAFGLTLGAVALWVNGERLRRPRPAERFAPHPEGQANSIPANSDETVFLGTVTRIDNTGDSHDPFLGWVVTLKIDKMIQGSLPRETFQLAIHSPSREGVELGHQYRISVRKSEAGYITAGDTPGFPSRPTCWSRNGAGNMDAIRLVCSAARAADCCRYQSRPGFRPEQKITEAKFVDECAHLEVHSLSDLRRHAFEGSVERCHWAAFHAAKSSVLRVLKRCSRPAYSSSGI